MYEEFIVNSSGAELYCRRYGQGEPVVMVHGSCTDADYWNDAAGVLSQRFCVWTYDRSGSGRSGESEDSSVAAQAQDLAAVIESARSAVGCTPVGTTVSEGRCSEEEDRENNDSASRESAPARPLHLIGHSAGCMVMMEYLRRHPEFDGKVLLYEPPASRTAQGTPEYAAAREKVREKIAQKRYAGALAAFMPLIGEQDPRGRERTQEELRGLDRNCRHFIMKEYTHLFSYLPDDESLRRMNVVIGVGELTHAAGKDGIYQGLAGEIGAEVIYFPGAHNGPFDLPREFAWIAEGIFEARF